jgi:SAM-dependent methyltransferase
VTFPAAMMTGSTGRVVATDISDKMVERVRRDAAARGLTHVVAERMDAEALAFADASFDVALCALGLMYVPDPIKALMECRRVLVPGGRVAAAVWGARNRCGWADIFPIVDRRVQSEVCPMFFGLGTGDTLAAAARAAGFEDIAVDRLTTTLEYESDADAVGAAFAGGPVALAYSRFDEVTRTEAQAEYLASIAQWRQGDRYRIPGEFVVIRGRVVAS